MKEVCHLSPHHHFYFEKKKLLKGISSSEINEMIDHLTRFEKHSTNITSKKSKIRTPLTQPLGKQLSKLTTEAIKNIFMRTVIQTNGCRESFKSLL